MTENISLEVVLDMPFEQALESVTAALKTQGFGVITSINFQATIKEKLNIDFRPYTILGACNPPIAYRALEHDSRVGLMLPCNVSIEAVADGLVLVRIADPIWMMSSMGGETDSVMIDIANQARIKLQAVIQHLK